MRIPDINDSSQFYNYFENENLENTDYMSHDDVNIRRPDAYIGFYNNLFSSQFSDIVIAEELGGLEWYNKLERR
jgi:hypothetical protein